MPRTQNKIPLLYSKWSSTLALSRRAPVCRARTSEWTSRSIESKEKVNACRYLSALVLGAPETSSLHFKVVRQKGSAEIAGNAGRSLENMRTKLNAALYLEHMCHVGWFPIQNWFLFISRENVSQNLEVEEEYHHAIEIFLNYEGGLIFNDHQDGRKILRDEFFEFHSCWQVWGRVSLSERYLRYRVVFFPTYFFFFLFFLNSLWWV